MQVTITIDVDGRKVTMGHEVPRVRPAAIAQVVQAHIENEVFGPEFPARFPEMAQ